MSGIYDQPDVEADVIPSLVNQLDTALSIKELKRLVSGVNEVIQRRLQPDPNQLRLFDPDNPPEAPSDNRLEGAQ